MRAFMWAKAKEWLLLGTLPDEDLLGDQLTLPGYHLNRRSRLVIESKEALQQRGEASPDDADAFVLIAQRRRGLRRRGRGARRARRRGRWRARVGVTG